MKLSDLDDLNEAKIDYLKQIDSLSIEGLKMIIDSYKENILEETKETKNKNRKVYLEGFEYEKWDKVLSSLNGYNKNLQYDHTEETDIIHNNLIFRDSFTNIKLNLKVSKPNFTYKDSRIVSFDKNNKLRSLVPEEYIKKLISREEENTNCVINFVDNKVYNINKLEFCSKNTDEVGLGLVKQKFKTQFNKSFLSNRILLLVSQRHKTYLRVFSIICRFIISMKRAVLLKRDKMDKVNKALLIKVFGGKNRNKEDKIFDNQLELNIDSINKKAYLDKLRIVKFFSCINNEDFIKNILLELNKNCVRGTVLSSGIRNNNDFDLNLGKKNKDDINVKKLKHFIKKTLRQHNLEEKEIKRQNLKKALFNSINTIKRKDEEKKLQVESDEHTSIAITPKSLIYTYDDKEEVSSSSQTSKSSNDNEEIVSRIKERRGNLKLKETNNDQLEKFISPIPKVDIIGLKLYIKDKLKNKK